MTRKREGKMTGKRYFMTKNEGAKTPFLKEKGVGSILFPNKGVERDISPTEYANFCHRE